MLEGSDLDAQTLPDAAQSGTPVSRHTPPSMAKHCPGTVPGGNLDMCVCVRNTHGRILKYEPTILSIYLKKIQREKMTKLDQVKCHRNHKKKGKPDQIMLSLETCSRAKGRPSATCFSSLYQHFLSWARRSKVTGGFVCVWRGAQPFCAAGLWFKMEPLNPRCQT